VLSAIGLPSETYTCPDWYLTIQAAKYLECRPWELLEQSIYWKEKALKAMEAEAGANKELGNRKR